MHTQQNSGFYRRKQSGWSKLLIISLLFFLPFCGRKKEGISPYSRTKFLLGTYVTIRVYSAGKPDSVIEKAFAEIKRISEKYSFEEKNSYLSVLNRGESSVDAETEFLLKFASRLYRESSGAFDPTVGKLKLLWGFNAKPRLPSDEEIRRALKWVGMDKLRIENGKIASKGILLDFSAFAKGYAVDRACEILERAGVTSALIDAGGDIRVLNSKPDGSPWQIGIKNPVGEGIIKVIELKDSAVATSGDYENYFIKDGKRYHHLLNPKTGYPARELHSVSVIAPTAMEADAYATAIFVLGREEGLKLARKLRVRVIAVDRQGKIWDSAFSN